MLDPKCTISQLLVSLAGHHGYESFLTTKITFFFYELNFIFMGAVIKM